MTCGSARDVNQPPIERSPMAIGMSWVSRITTVSLQMVVPGIIGYWLDRRFGTRALFTLCGFGIGMFSGMLHLIRITKTKSMPEQSSPVDHQSESTGQENTRSG